MLTSANGAGVVWITGRPAAGKTTLARRLADAVRAAGGRAELIDSDEVRRVVTPEPAYSEAERAVFYRALAYLARRLADAGVVAIVAATANRAEYRRWAREICPGLVLVHARCSLAAAEARDPKGLYARARLDPGNTLPGLGVPYEEPEDADVVVDVEVAPSAAEIERILDALWGTGKG